MKVWWYLFVNWLAVVFIFMLFVAFGVVISIMAANQLELFEENGLWLLLFIFIIAPFGIGGSMAAVMYFDWAIGLESNSKRFKEIRGEP